MTPISDTSPCSPTRRDKISAGPFPPRRVSQPAPPRAPASPQFFLAAPPTAEHSAQARMKLQQSRLSLWDSSFPPLLPIPSPHRQNKSQNLVRGVAAEEGIGFPAGTCGSVGGVEEQAAREFLVEGGGLEIDRLIHVVGWRVVAVGEPVLENFLFRCARFEGNVAFDGGHALLDEVVLIAADEEVAKRFGIGDGFDAHGLRDGGGASAEVGFLETADLEDFKRDDGKKHVHVDVSDDGFRRDGGMSREIFGTEQAFFFGGDEKKENRALEFFRMCFEARGNVHDESAAGAIVHGAIVNAIAINGSSDADMIDVRGEDDEFILESGIGAGEFGDDVG